MLVYFVRHGTAYHLLEDYRRKVTRKEFCNLLDDWLIASLTDTGKEEIRNRVEEMKDTTYHLFYSPLIRTRQSAKPFSKNPEILTNQEMPALAEIIIPPPSFPFKLKLPIGTWITLCVIRSFYTLSVVKYLKEARKIMNEVSNKGNDALLVSHQARIITLLLYCSLSFKWRILRLNVKPAGLSIVARR